MLAYGYYGECIVISEQNRWMGPKRYDWAGNWTILRRAALNEQSSLCEPHCRCYGTRRSPPPPSLPALLTAPSPWTWQRSLHTEEQICLSCWCDDFVISFRDEHGVCVSHTSNRLLLFQWGALPTCHSLPDCSSPDAHCGTVPSFHLHACSLVVLRNCVLQWLRQIAGFKKLCEHKLYDGEITYLPSSDKESHPRDGTRCRAGYETTHQFCFTACLQFPLFYHKDEQTREKRCKKQQSVQTGHANLANWAVEPVSRGRSMQGFDFLLIFRAISRICSF